MSFALAARRLRHARTLAPLAFVALLGAGATPGPAQSAGCPDSFLQITKRFDAPVPSSAPARDSSVVVTGPDGVPRVLRAAYDIPGGTVRVWVEPVGFCAVMSRVVDRFVVTGAPPGTPIALVALLDVDGDLSGCSGTRCSARFGGSIQNGGVVAEEYVDVTTARQELHTTLQYPVTLLAGNETELGFEIRFTVGAGSIYSGSGSGRIRFSGLPPGTSLVSCNGYAAFPVPVRPGTWGGIKTAYR